MNLVKVKKLVIAPILIIIIIGCLLFILVQIINGTFLVSYKTIIYSSGCKEVLLPNGTNLTPLCKDDRLLLDILNYSGNYTESNNNIKYYNISQPNISVKVNTQ
ncbi:MAG: hypothetical protein ACOCVF_04040 [bacterium]